MRYLAGSLFGHGLYGPLRTLMMEGAVIQMLAVQAAEAAERPRPPAAVVHGAGTRRRA
jgi:hypothetical protein